MYAARDDAVEAVVDTIDKRIREHRFVRSRYVFWREPAQPGEVQEAVMSEISDVLYHMGQLDSYVAQCHYQNIYNVAMDELPALLREKITIDKAMNRRFFTHADTYIVYTAGGGVGGYAWSNIVVQQAQLPDAVAAVVGGVGTIFGALTAEHIVLPEIYANYNRKLETLRDVLIEAWYD